MSAAGEMGVAFVVADSEGHAVAVVPTMEAAFNAAGDDAHRVADAEYQGDEPIHLAWSIQRNERCPEWTVLVASLTGEPAGTAELARYVITELADTGQGVFKQVAPRCEVTLVRTELLVKEPDTGAWKPADAPEGAKPPVEAVVTEDAPEPDAAPRVATEPPQEAESAAAPSDDPVFDVPCEGRHEGCSGNIENEKQLELSQFKLRAKLCNSCYRYEVRNNLAPRPA